MKIKKSNPETEKRAVRRLIKKYPPPAKILDVGTRDGYSIYLLSKRGYDVSGTDIDKKYVKMCQSYGFNVIHDDFQRTNVSGEFDIIYSSHVIEHCENSVLFMKSAYKLLKKSGIVFIYFPLEKAKRKKCYIRKPEAMKHIQFWPTLESFKTGVLDHIEFKTIELYVSRKWRKHVEALYIGKKI